MVRVSALCACCLFFVSCAPPPAPAPTTQPATTQPATTVAPPPPPKPTMNLTFGPPKVQGNMAVEAVVGAVASKGPALSSCAPIGSSGAVVVTLTLKGDGSVATSTVTSSGLTPAVETCVANQTRAWTFSPPRGGIARLEVPITFATR